MDMNQHMSAEQWALASTAFEQQTRTRLREAKFSEEEIDKHLARNEEGNYTFPTTCMRWPEYVMGVIHANSLLAGVQMKFVLYRKFLEVLVHGVNSDDPATLEPGLKAIYDAFEALDPDKVALTMESLETLLAKAVHGALPDDPSGLAAAPGVLSEIKPAELDDVERTRQLHQTGMACPDEGCPHYGSPHSHSDDDHAA